MSKELIEGVRLVEKYKQAIPELERLLVTGGYCYFAGSLMLSMKDPMTGAKLTAIDIKPIGDSASEIIQKGQYLASLLFVAHKSKTSCFYNQALSNIEDYEKVHGRELEPAGTDAIS
jgi:hypothetical protein